MPDSGDFDEDGWSPEKEKPLGERLLKKFEEAMGQLAGGVGGQVSAWPRPCGTHSYEVVEVGMRRFRLCRQCGDFAELEIREPIASGEMERRNATCRVIVSQLSDVDLDLCGEDEKPIVVSQDVYHALRQLILNAKAVGL